MKYFKTKSLCTVGLVVGNILLFSQCMRMMNNSTEECIGSIFLIASTILITPQVLRFIWSR